MTAHRVMLTGAVLWALAIVLSATLFRGRALGDWIEGFLLAGWIVYFSYWAGKSGRTWE